jgi:hypothetical protein
VNPTTTIERETVELRPFYVVSHDDDGTLVDVTSETVEVAFARRLNRPVTWHTAAWAAGGPFESPIGRAWAAEVEVGGVGTGANVELYPGPWCCYVRVTTSDEQPVLDAGTLTVH